MTERGGAKAVVLLALAILVVAGLGAVAFVFVISDDSGPDVEPSPDRPDPSQAQAAADRFARALSDLAPEAAGTEQPGADVAADLTAATEGLGELDLEVTAGDVALDDDDGRRATAEMSTDWSITGARWSSTGSLDLRLVGSEWRARWSLSALDDRLADGDTLAVEATDAERAPILDGAGRPLVALTPVVVVGVEPQRATDVAALTAQLALLLDIDAAELTARISAAQPNEFVEVITLRRSEYDPLRARLQPLPGTVFREDEMLLAPSRTFARAVLGTIGPASAEQVDASDGSLSAGDVAGQGGLQARYDEVLRGTPGLRVQVTRAPPGGDRPGSTTVPSTEPGQPAVLEPLVTVDPVPGRPVQTTLDTAIQLAAEAALAGEIRVASIVALRVSTAEILAVANAPAGTNSSIGLTAEVPPGSTFKVVSTLALLRRGLNPDEPVACPPTVAIGGRSFKNAADGSIAGSPPFRLDFAESCNTAFVALSERLEPGDLAAAGAAFGLGGDWDIGLSASTGSVPTTTDAVDTAASTIGQGRLVVSPLVMANVAATVGSGTWQPPNLVVAPAPAGRPPPVPLAEADTLRALMRGVVTDGTGDAVAGVPGGEVFAKTGTAEFGTEVPPRAHGWMIGYQGDVAFAVFVEGGESGSRTAGPIAARFLTSLAGG